MLKQITAIIILKTVKRFIVISI